MDEKRYQLSFTATEFENLKKDVNSDSVLDLVGDDLPGLVALIKMVEDEDFVDLEK